MSDQNVPLSIINRVKKLMALAADGSGATENEASVAAEKAQALLQEYNLSLAEIGDGSTPAADTARAKTTTDLSARHEWQANLMASVARNNFCYHAIQKKWTTRPGSNTNRMRRWHYLIGRQVNIAVATETYVYLVATMERLCPYTDRRDRSHKSWFAGCVDRVGARLSEQRQRAEAEDRARRGEANRGSGTDLVLADVYSSEEDLNADFRWGYEPGTTARRRAEREARDAAFRAERETWTWEREAAVVVPVRPPTAAEIKKAEAQARRDQRWYEGYQRRQQKEAARVDHWAYSQGRRAGDDVGLDKQVKGGGTRDRLS